MTKELWKVPGTFDHAMYEALRKGMETARTTVELAATLGIARSSLYRYFGTWGIDINEVSKKMIDNAAKHQAETKEKAKIEENKPKRRGRLELVNGQLLMVV